MSAVFSRWLPCATLTAWSAILLYFYISGRIADFLHPMFRPGVLIAGIAMAVMAALFIFVPGTADCCATEECGHPLSRFGAGKALTFLILLVPFIVTALTSSDQFTQNVMKNRGIITDASQLRPPPSRAQGQTQEQSSSATLDLPLPSKDGEAAPGESAAAPAPGSTAAAQANTQSFNDYLQRTPEGYIVAEVLDLLYAAQDSALRKDFDNKTVQLVGQLMPDADNNAGGNRFKAVRMFMTCCAADARPVAVLAESATPPTLPEMTWIKITGTATFPIENGRRTAVIKAQTIEKTQPPEESMLY